MRCLKMIYNNVEMTIEVTDKKYMTTTEINIVEWLVALELVEIEGMLSLAIHQLQINHSATFMERKNVVEMEAYELVHI